MDYASLCFLSYNRFGSLLKAVDTAVSHAGMPVEVIVHDDGSEPRLRDALLEMQDRGLISTLILNPTGHNEGVGRAINRSFALATGDPIVKIDQDVTFEPGWLKKIYEVIDKDGTVGMAGLFKYGHPPVEWQKMQLEPGPATCETPYHYVQDFVGSVMVVPRSIYELFGPLEEHSAAFAEDVAYKKELQAYGFNLVLPDTDLATNSGFGPGPSTIVSMQGDEVVVTPIFTGPVIHD